MSNAKDKLTNQILESPEFRPTGYTVAAQFHEPLKLLPQKGFEFAAKLTDFVDPRGVMLKEDAWVFAQPLGESALGFLRAVIQPNTITLEANGATYVMEYFETRCRFVLEEFQRNFLPTWLPASMAKVSGTLDVDGDARAVLCEHLTKLSDRVQILGRPIQLFGIRFAMPPFEARDQSSGRGRGKLIASEDWSAELRAESLFADPGKLYLEATGSWVLPTPKRWNEGTIEEVIQHLGKVSTYLREHLIPFLRKRAENGENQNDTSL